MEAVIAARTPSARTHREYRENVELYREAHGGVSALSVGPGEPTNARVLRARLLLEL